MKKWTMPHSNASASQRTRAAASSCIPSSTSLGVVSLQHILEVRGGPLNEIECWSLLGQTGHALQDHLLSINGRRRAEQSASWANLPSASASSSSSQLLVITPHKLLCSVSGKVVLDPLDQNQCQSLLARAPTNEVSPSNATYRHPLLRAHRPGAVGGDFFTECNVERDLEAFGVFSLACTIQFGLSYSPASLVGQNHHNHKHGMSDNHGSAELHELLQGMQRPNPSQSVSLLELLQRVADHWQTIVGSSPISRFVSQLYRVTQASRPSESHAAKSNSFMPHSNSCSAIALTNHDSRTNVILNQCLIDPVAKATAPPMIEVEFSRLDTSSSSSCESSSASPVPSTDGAGLASALAAGSLPNLNNNHKEGNIEAPMSGDLGGSRQNIHQPPIHHLGEEEQPDHRVNRAGQTTRRNFKSSSTRTLDYENISVETNLNREKSHSTHDTLVASGLNLPVTPKSHRGRGAKQTTITSTASTTASIPFGRRPLPPHQQTPQQHREQPLNGPGEPATLLANTPSSRRRRVQRNPSRLYRVVKPLAEITPTPSPATKRCIGPEFVVMSDNQPIVMDLSSHTSSRKDSQSKQVSVVLLNGQRITVLCSPLTMTIGELLDQILSQQDIKETCYYGLALHVDDEYWILASDTKLSKVAPNSWKDSRFTGCSSFTLHLRFKYLPDSMDSFKDPNNMHQFYLQLRTDVIDGLYNMSASQHVAMAGIALHTEFGDFSEDIHGDGYYFILDHYLPRHVIRQLGEDEARQSMTRLHRAHLGQSQSKTELKYCKELQRLDNFGFHNFTIRETKKSSSSHLNTSSSSALSSSSTSQSLAKSSSRRHIGIHMQGMFLFESSRDPAVSHKIIGSFLWHQISRIQYDKSRFQLSVQDEEDKEKTLKMKFYVPELKAKVMFDLSSAHHQFCIQQRWNSAKNLGFGPGNSTGGESSSQKPRVVPTPSGSDQVEYREPRDKAIRSLKNRLLPKRQISQRKIYTKNPSLSSSTPSVASGSSTHSSSVVSTRRASGAGGRRSSTGSATTSAKLMVKRLTHYTSMANAKDKKDSFVTETGCSPNNKMEEDTIEQQLNASNKENQTPNTGHQQSYRYKVYLEPEEDDNPNGMRPSHPSRMPLQEKPISLLLQGQASPSPPPTLPRRTRASTLLATRIRAPSIATSAAQPRRRSETRTPATTKTPIVTGARRATRRSMGPPGGGVASSANSNSVRMGTRISMSALHRERIRLATEMGIPLPPAPKKRSLDLDYDTMEVKSLILPPKPPSQSSMGIHTVIENRPMVYDNGEESLTDSLIERFDNMESEDGEPERQIVLVSLVKDAQGKLGLKITGTPSGIYIDRIDGQVANIEGHLKMGDRIVAINGRSLENVPYSGALQLIRNSSSTVQFLVSQIKG